MENGWSIALYFSGIAACLALATVLKLRVKIFQRHLMPTSMACRSNRIYKSSTCPICLWMAHRGTVAKDSA